MSTATTSGGSTFTDGTRGGLLGQASVLTVTSYPNRTSVTVRGQVAAREPARRAAAAAAARHSGAGGSRRADGQPRSLRERMEMHREESGVRVVPPADGSARVRARELRRARQVAHGRATARRSIRRRRSPTARRFEGIAGAARADGQPQGRLRADAQRQAAGLRRSAAGSTITTCRRSARIAREAAPADYRWSSIITGIVKSTPFSMGVATGATSAGRETQRA